jgi:hypothetical protein
MKLQHSEPQLVNSPIGLQSRLDRGLAQDRAVGVAGLGECEQTRVGVHKQLFALRLALFLGSPSGKGWGAYDTPW